VSPDEIAAGRERWQARYDAARKREADFTTLSGVEVAPVYGPRPATRTRASSASAGRGVPVHPRACTPPATADGPWTIRQFAGFGNAQQTNERYKMILAAGGGGLSVAFDMPTLMGRDSDDPRRSARWATAASPSTAPSTWTCCSATSRSATSRPR
jgi:methylmalonyl-CoA mutase N-terminal domain/subunit